MEKRSSKGWGVGILTLAGVIVVLMMVASWAPDSRMTALRWIPDGVAEWADRDPNRRTAAPFIPLVMFLALGFSWTGMKWPLVGALLVSACCLGLLEAGQHFIPGRTADMKDLMWGSAGIAVGLVVGAVLLKLTRLRPTNREC